MKAHFRARGGLLTPVEPAQCKAGEEFSRGLACLSRGMGKPQLTVPECEGPGVTCPSLVVTWDKRRIGELQSSLTGAELYIHVQSRSSSY